MSRSPPSTWPTAMRSRRLRAVQRVLAIPMLYVTHSPAEAIALGSRLFLLEQGRIVAEGPPLDVLSAVSRTGRTDTIAWEGIRNVFPARVIGPRARARSATRLRLDDGPELIVPFLDRPAGTRLLVEIRADDILLARQPVGGLSRPQPDPRHRRADRPPRPRSRGRRPHRRLTWIVSLVAPAVDQLELVPGTVGPHDRQGTELPRPRRSHHRSPRD